MSFQKAQRKRAKLRLAMFGPSGSGKTYSSLLLAQGIGNKIALIDTERGSGELYADLCNYDVASIEPPFSPDKYLKLIHEAESGGYDVIIIDSLSHAWAGDGGLLDIHDKATQSSQSKNSYMAWREVTPLHNRLIDAILQSPAHVIVTARSKVAYEVQETDRGKKAPVKVGLAPVFREGLDYEMTVCFELSVDNNIATASKDRTSLFKGKYFTPDKETGAILHEWLESGVDPVEEAIKKAQADISACSTVGGLTELWNREKERGEWPRLGIVDRAKELLAVRKAEIEAQQPKTTVNCPDTGTVRKAVDCETCKKREGCPEVSCG